MRTEIVQGDDFSVTVRGKIRRTVAYQSQYTLYLKQTDDIMRDLETDDPVDKNPAGWTLIGLASGFSSLVARASRVLCVDGQEWAEPFNPEQLRFLFTHFLDSEQLPNRSDLWSRVEDTIKRMDEPPPPDPKA